MSATDSDITFDFIDQIDAVSADQWQALVSTDNPFVSYDYLQTLETSGATGPHTGWLPHYLIARDSNHQLRAAVPLFIKDDSWGEFVFDFAWADAYHRHGVPYYPKLVTAVPYTPVPGPRFFCRPHERDTLLPLLIDAIQAEAEKLECSSWHILFPQQDELTALEDHSLLMRKDCQFHWFNRGYQSFEHYLEHFRASRRKKCRRERRKVREENIEIEWRAGPDLDQQEWETFYELYASSFYKRGRTPYFTLDFFTQLARSSQVNMQLVFAQREQRRIAVAMFFASSDRLYGRYWGSNEFVDGLHFELCYYQGIEYCIEHGLQQFDPGVQGEHKIARGFQATPSYSAHWLKLPPFADAIRAHIGREREHIDAYMLEVDKHLPFHREAADEPSSLD